MEQMLHSSLCMGEVRFPNRVVLQPMEGCDCGADGAPGELTRSKYLRAARSGAGTIWMEACAVCPEGRSNPRQMMLTRQTLPHLQALIREMRDTALRECGIRPVILLQLTHSGRQSIRPMIACHNRLYEKTRPVAEDAVVSDGYLRTLAARYRDTALLAVEAGADGVDVKSCHGYLFQELLSAYDRPGDYGGSLTNRSRLYLESVRAVREAVPENFILASRLGVSDMIPRPCGFGTDASGQLDLTESEQLIGALVGAGVRMLNVTLGNPYYNPHVNRPYRKGPYPPPEAPEAGLARFRQAEQRIKQQFPKLLVVGSGLSYYREDLFAQSEALLQDGVCDLVGYGRAFLAYPMFYRDYLEGRYDPKKSCVACSRCTELMRSGCVSGCAVFQEEYKTLYKEQILCKR